MEEALEGAMFGTIPFTEDITIGAASGLVVSMMVMLPILGTALGTTGAGTY